MEGFGASLLEEAAEVAVGDDTDQLASLLDGGHTEAFGGHLVNDLRHGGRGSDRGQGFALMHELADAGETPAELATGVEVGKIVRLEAERAADLDGEGIAEREHGGGGGGGCQLHIAGLAGDADVERNDAGLGEGGGVASAEADKRDADAFEGGDELEQLVGFAGVRESEDDVAAGEDADVAVEGFGGVQKVRGGAGRDHRGGDFARDEAAFADAAEDHAVVGLGGVDDERAGGVESGVHGAAGGKAESEGLERGGFNLDQVGGGSGGSV